MSNTLTDLVEYVVDGDAVNTLLQGYGINNDMLPGQVFEIVEKKLVHGLADEIDKAKPRFVRFVNLESIPKGPHADFAYAICGGLSELARTLAGKGIGTVGTIRDPSVLPQNIVFRISKSSKAPAQTD